MQATPVNQTNLAADTDAFNYFNQTNPPRLTNRLTNTEVSSAEKYSDKLSLSRQSIAFAQNPAEETTDKAEKQTADEQENKESDPSTAPKSTQSETDKALTEQEQQQVQELKRRDAQVKAHEQAHLSAAGGLAKGSASFDYETGPDGKRYAVGGEVNIDTSQVSDDPQANLRKAQQIRRAATAPADPSAQDRSVAAEAARMEAQARVELSEQSREQQAQLVSDNSPETDFLSRQYSQAEKAIQDTYRKIQNATVLEQPSAVDFFI